MIGLRKSNGYSPRRMGVLPVGSVENGYGPLNKYKKNRKKIINVFF
jgi:hypothetical protein